MQRLAHHRAIEVGRLAPLRAAAVKDMVLAGERATWPRLPAVRARVTIEQEVAKAIARLESK